MSSRGRCPTACKVEINIGGSRPSDKGKPGHPDPEKKSGGGGGGKNGKIFKPRGDLRNNFISPLGLSLV